MRRLVVIAGVALAAQELLARVIVGDALMAQLLAPSLDAWPSLGVVMTALSLRLAVIVVLLPVAAGLAAHRLARRLIGPRGRTPPRRPRRAA